jgi:plastocyanin
VVVVVGAYLIYSNNNSYQTPLPTGPSQPNTPPVSTTTQITSTSTTSVISNISVSIKNFAFSPATLNIKTGTKVTWTNNDSVSHTVTSDSGTTLNSSTLAPGQSYGVTFTNPVSVGYHCSIHPMMKGTVVVTN